MGVRREKALDVLPERAAPSRAPRASETRRRTLLEDLCAAIVRLVPGGDVERVEVPALDIARCAVARGLPVRLVVTTRDGAQVDIVVAVTRVAR